MEPRKLRPFQSTTRLALLLVGGKPRTCPALHEELCSWLPVMDSTVTCARHIASFWLRRRRRRRRLALVMAMTRRMFHPGCPFQAQARRAPSEESQRRDKGKMVSCVLSLDRPAREKQLHIWGCRMAGRWSLFIREIGCFKWSAEGRQV